MLAGKAPRHEIFPLPRPDKGLVVALLPPVCNEVDVDAIFGLCVIIAAGLNTLDAGGRPCGFGTLAAARQSISIDSAVGLASSESKGNSR